MNKDLLEEIYSKYYSELYLYAYSLTGSHHAAQELCSDTFFKALISCSDDCPSIRYWLLRVCKNCWIDRWRKERRNVGSVNETLPAKDCDPLEHILQKEERIALYRAILQLPPESREAILLFYFYGFKTEQIAQLCGRTSGATRTLLYRARLQLREQLKEEE